MRRIGITSLACSAFLMVALAATSFATPSPNGATIEPRTFNDCPLSTLTTVNSYPASIQISDTMHPTCVGFANLHSWSFSADGGTTAAVFNNNSDYHFGADLNISGAGEGEGGLRISPWYGKFVDGRFMLNVTSGEIACFGGALPFYSFTVNHGITYTRGTTVRMEVTYRANDLYDDSPATIQYRVIQGGNTYDSPELLFGKQNGAECDPNGLWGMLNDGRVGGYFQPRANTGANLTATWSNIAYTTLEPVGTPNPDAASIEQRTFNDCAISTLTVNNNYSSSIEITDDMSPLCAGFANLHGWSFSDDGGGTAAEFNDNSYIHVSADLTISGAGEGEGGLRISPWYGKFVDGRFMANVTSGEIACFGGALPFYSFTANHGITYVRGTTIRMQVTYIANDLIGADPATIQYRVIQGGVTYDSPVLPFGKQNAGECDPYSLWGMLNDGRVGGYFQPRANTGEALTGQWTNIRFSDCPESPDVDLFMLPRRHNLRARGWPILAIIDPPTPYSPNDIDVASLRLNGVAPVPGSGTSLFGRLWVRFPRPEVNETLFPGDKVPMWVTGSIGNSCFEAIDHIKVKQPKIHKPEPSAVLNAGSEIDIEWTDADDIEAPTLKLLASFDGGESWSIQAENIANDGSYRWTVPQVMGTEQARVALVTVFEEDETVTETEVAESDNFTITSQVGVGDVPVSFALRSITPNPSPGRFTVTFALASGAPAELSVFDVGGRLVSSQDVGRLGAGVHQIDLGRRQALPAGVYLVQLSQSGQKLTRRAIVVQ